MLLSKLVYLTVKNTVYFDDKSFNFQNFKRQAFEDSPDYAQNIVNAFTPINEAIARLSDLEKIPYRVDEVAVSDISNGVIQFAKLKKPVKEIVSVAQLYGDSEYRLLEWRAFGIDQIRVASPIDPYRPVVVEYKEDIPQFDESSYDYGFEIEGGEYIETYSDDVELKDFGITDSMCNFIMEYAQGKLNEPMAAELANMHITRAEQYFKNITPVQSAFVQRVVQPMYTIGD